MKQSLENAGQEKKNYTSSPFQGPSFLFFSFVSIVSASMFIWNPEAGVKAEFEGHYFLCRFTSIKIH